MSGVLRAELIKITTTRPWWIVFICVVVLSGCSAAVVAMLQPGPAAFDDPGVVRSIYNSGNPLTRVLVMVVGIAAMAGEYRHSTLATTFLATPRRMRVLLGKAMGLLLFGLLYGVASVGAAVAVAVPFVLAADGSLFLDRVGTWRSLVLGVVSLALWSMIGMGLGILVKNMLAAMLVGISFAYLVEPILAVLCYYQGWDTPLNLLPSGATNATLQVTSPVLFASADPVAWWQGLLVLGAWTLTPAAIGLLANARRDVT